MSIFLISLYGATILYALFPIKCSKVINKYFWLWCAIVLCILTITSETYADLYNYENYFDDVNIKQWALNYRAMPLAWGWLCVFFGKLSMTYRGMFCCILIISSYLTHLFVQKLDCNEKVFWGLFLIFPGLIQAVQLRFFLGSSLAMYGFSFIIKDSLSRKEEIKNYIFFGIFTILAALVHSSCIFIAILFFVKFFKNLSISKSVAITFGGAMLLTVLLPFVPEVLSHFIDPFYIQRYFTASTSKTTMIRFFKILVVWFANVGLAYLALYSNKSIRINDRYGETQNRWIISRCFTGICLFAISLPLLRFDENFHRFFEMGFMLLYVIYSKLTLKKNSSNISNRRIILLLILVCLIYCIYVYYPLDSIVYPLFKFDGFMPIFR